MIPRVRKGKIPCMVIKNGCGYKMIYDYKK